MPKAKGKNRCYDETPKKKYETNPVSWLTDLLWALLFRPASGFKPYGTTDEAS